MTRTTTPPFLLRFEWEIEFLKGIDHGSRSPTLSVMGGTVGGRYKIIVLKFVYFFNFLKMSLMSLGSGSRTVPVNDRNEILNTTKVDRQGDESNVKTLFNPLTM